MKTNKDLEVLTKVVSLLKELDEDSQKRTIRSILTFLNISLSKTVVGYEDNSISKTLENASIGRSDKFFTEDRSMTPKDFLREKTPLKDSERIACLAYYLTHFREMPHFKTIDLSTLNTEAAQPKFSNAAVAVNNATRDGLLALASKGKKQISAAGEVFVQALPNREAAKAALSSMRIKRRNKKQISKPSNKIR